MVAQPLHQWKLQHLPTGYSFTCSCGYCGPIVPHAEALAEAMRHISRPNLRQVPLPDSNA